MEMQDEQGAEEEHVTTNIKWRVLSSDFEWKYFAFAWYNKKHIMLSTLFILFLLLKMCFVCL